ncbi:hypothetical protein PGTUg99_026171 [Puccinia graminis f. sp. tritici]|uniref:Uncharacterized protein n=1 Tax=Puccinia graminis f. sp. tritici TaxID=56615 RepID=A0A5B0SE46_PUCGR|nr:hypothetical protein PGTUg99_026171 [Puccinia graminis f. sp. tritici]
MDPGEPLAPQCTLLPHHSTPPSTIFPHPPSPNSRKDTSKRGVTNNFGQKLTMDNHEPDQTSLSFRDFPAHPNGQVRRKLYKPSADLQFDLEMARRSSKINGDNQVNGTSEQSNPTETVKSEPIEFGLISQHPGIDEEILEKLAIPPPLKYQLGLQRELRPRAIFIYNRSIALLKTDQIISHVLQLLAGRKAIFKHLEWVDDFSCVLEFASDTDAIEGFTGLLVRPDEVEGENGLPEAFAYLSSQESSDEVYAAAYEFVCTHRPAKPFPECLFEANPKNKFHRPTQPEQMIPFVRFATNADVKDSRARKQSMFYALNGVGAGQEGVLSEQAGSIGSRRKPSLVRPLPPDILNASLPLAARLVKPLPKTAPKAKQPRPKVGVLDDELARFMSKAIEVKPSIDRPNRKREREEESIEEEKQGEAGAELELEAKPTPSRKRRMPSPSAMKPSVELLPDRPGTCGGNLRDEVFSSEKLVTDFQDVKPKPKATDDQDAPRESEEQSTMDGQKLTEGLFDRPIPGGVAEPIEQDADDDQKMIDIGNPSQLVEPPKQPTPPPPRVPKPEPKTRGGRWGPLFSRLC